MPNSTPTWITEALTAWAKSKTKLQPGVSIGAIREAEQVLQFSFPQDFIDLYTIVNGFEDWDMNEHMFSLWPLERILAQHAKDEDSDYITPVIDDNDYIPFCDFLINSHFIGFSKTNGFIYNDHDMLTPVTDSFQQLIWMINNGDKAVY